MKTASEAIPLYLDELRLAKRSPRTIATYRQALNVFMKIVGGTTPLSEDTYKKFLQRTSELTPFTQITYRAAVCQLYEYHSPGIPLKLLNRRYGQKRPKRQLQYREEAVEKTIAYVEQMECKTLLDYRDRAFIILLADSGLRISEACSLTRGDVDWRKGLTVIIGKGDKQGVIYWSERSMSYMKAYLAARSDLDGKSGKPLASLPLFARHDDGAGSKVKRVGPKGMWAAISLRVREAGCEEHEISPHKFRHHFVTTTYRQSKDIVLAMELARHDDIATTKKYAHLSSDEVKKKYKEIFNANRTPVPG